MKISMYMPLGDIAPGEFQTMPAIREMVQALETAKVSATCLTEHPAPDAQWLHANGHDAVDPFAALSFVAMASTTLLLHTNVVVLPYRNPFLTAKAAATLQVLSGGRLIMGVGVGYQKGEFDALGVDFHKRGALADEALEVLRMAWSGGAVVKQGRNFHAVGNEPRPVPSPPPSIWIGGGSDKAIERAARWGDGWCPFFAAPTQSQINRDTGIQSPAQLAGKIVQLRERREELGRTGAFAISAERQLKVNERSPAEAQRFVDSLGELTDVGVDWAVVTARHGCRGEYLDDVRWFGENVIATL